MTKRECQGVFCEYETQLRTKESYDAAVAKIRAGDPSYESSNTSIKRGCILNELKYFHATTSYGLDAMHDILEGIVPYALFQRLLFVKA